jgi:hypothetical protein
VLRNAGEWPASERAPRSLEEAVDWLVHVLAGAIGPDERPFGFQRDSLVAAVMMTGASSPEPEVWLWIHGLILHGPVEVSAELGQPSADLGERASLSAWWDLVAEIERVANEGVRRVRALQRAGVTGIADWRHPSWAAPIQAAGPGGEIASMWSWFASAPPKGGERQWKDGRSAKELARAWTRCTRPIRDAGPYIPVLARASPTRVARVARLSARNERHGLWDVHPEHVTPLDTLRRREPEPRSDCRRHREGRRNVDRDRGEGR